MSTIRAASVTVRRACSASKASIRRSPLARPPMWSLLRGAALLVAIRRFCAMRRNCSTRRGHGFKLVFMNSPNASRQWPAEGFTRAPYWVYGDHEVYAREQETIFRGKSWHYLGLEAEVPDPGCYKTTYIG